MLKQILKIFWSCTQFYLPGNKSAASVSLSNSQSMLTRHLPYSGSTNDAPTTSA